MDNVLKDIIDSPKLPDYVDELQQYLLQEEAKRTAFYENVSDDEKAEFINGEVIFSSPARDKHTVIVYNLSSIFIRFARKNKAGVVRGEKSLVRLRRNDFEPDVCFFRKEISDTFIDDTMFYPVPDFVVEVLSDSTEKRDRGVKFVDYALNGVKEYWLVNYKNQFIEQYFLEKEVFVLAEKVKHGTVRCLVLEGLEIPLKAIFNEEHNELFLREMI
ncbi:MAG TPA: Uma2 family endonuclease [Segetibacter sp.]|nr:Uma2 family endonuclease [Segetibacter sp.]